MHSRNTWARREMRTKIWLDSLKIFNFKGIHGDNIKIDLTKAGWEGVDWIHVAQDRDRRRDLVDTVIKVR
jgi:hypothetical protein